MLFLCKNPNLNCKFSLTATPRDGNCLLHAIIDGVLNNEAFKHSNNMVEADSWRQLLFKLGLFNANVDEGQKIQFLRNRWVLGASQWLAGKNGSKENDKIILGYSDQEWEYIWATMIENGAWAVPAIKDMEENIVKENQAPELFIKFIAHDLQCNIVVFDLYNNTVEFCSGNQLLENNVKFVSPLLLYTTGSHFQSVIPKDNENFVQYAIELETKYSVNQVSVRQPPREVKRCEQPFSEIKPKKANVEHVLLSKKQ